MMRYKSILAIICVIGISVAFSAPTARTYIFAAMENYFSDSLIDSLAKYFDVIISHDPHRGFNPLLRDSSQVPWHRDKPPTLLMYKDAMTINQNDTLQGGGGATVGGFAHFDSIFFEKNGFC